MIMANDAGAASVPWSSLSRSKDKRRILSQDTFFREGIDTIFDLLGEEHAKNWLQLHALSFLKSDSFVFGTARKYIEYLYSAGFEAVIAEDFELSHMKMRALWQYQWNIATLDRINVLSKINLFTDNLVLILRDKRPILGIPASVRLASLKGSADPAVRSQDSIRSVLNCPNVYFSSVHISDEPADVAREMSIIFDKRYFKNVMSRSRNLKVISAQEIESLFAKREIHPTSFSPADSARRILSCLQADQSLEKIFPKEVEAIINLSQRTKPSLIANWRLFLNYIEKEGISLPLWDELVVSSVLVIADLPKKTQILGGIDPKSWNFQGKENSK